MKFTTAYANTASQNSALKFALLCLSTVVILLGIVSLRSANRPPLLIERSCYTKAVESSDTTHSVSEIKAFMDLSLRARFDSNSTSSELFLSPSELENRNKEQATFSSKKMRQTIIVNSMKIDKSNILVDADRVISVGSIRSAFAFPLKVELTKVSRSALNPWGLILQNVSELKKKEKQNEK